MRLFKKKNKDISKNIPKELPTLAMDLIEENEEKQPTKNLEETKKTDITTKSYFSDLLKAISKETELLENDEEYYKKKINLYGENILSKDLISNMKEHWIKQRGNIIFTNEEKKLKDDIFNKIEKLQKLEEEWQTHHLRLIEKEENIRKEESSLKDVLKKFKELCSRHIEKKIKEKRLEGVKPEHYFYINNGNIIKNIYDLKNSLKNMDEETFKHHVNENKNDFAVWIRDVIKDDNLARSISKANTKEELMGILS